MNTISPWTATVLSDLANSEVLLEKNVLDYTFQMCNTADSSWIIVQWPNGGKMAFRAAYGLNSIFEIDNLFDDDNTIVLQLSNKIGKYEIQLQFPDLTQPVFHYTTTFHPNFPILIPFWPRDIVPVTKNGKIENTSGNIHVSQIGTRTGLLFSSFTKPKTGSFLYFQNLTDLSDYCDATETSLANTVGGQWPEMGFQLPVTANIPLPDKKFVVSDAYVWLGEEVYNDHIAIATNFLDSLAKIYRCIPKPETKYADWQEISKKALSDLTFNKGCWTHADGHSYLNAYLCDYDTPAEIMVQLAVMYAIKEYADWTGDKYPVINEIKAGINAFYDPELKTISRWLPSKREDLDASEEQKSALTMDSWYLHHPLINLSKLALQGDSAAKDLLMKSLDYAIRVAHRFDYQWPVFYKMDTLEILKKETEPGKGGEKDVAGGYALLMLNVWKLTDEKKYLAEAIKAAKRLGANGLDIFYQANTTAFSALAMLRLYRETGDEHFLKISYLCLAGIMKNVQLWECNYGNAKNAINFFGVFPLNNAPYKAAYEEMEVYGALNDYLIEAKSIDAPILPSLQLLLSEFVKYSINRLSSYYPPLLTTDMLSNQVKTGEIDSNLWIPVEDIHDGWEQHGQVGQEVYGAGVGFGIVPRQYHKVKGERFLVYCDYPVLNFKISNYKSAVFTILGDELLQCRVQIICDKKLKHSDFIVSTGPDKKSTVFKTTKQTDMMMEFLIPGNTIVKIKWK